jgi:hypothetical protein
VVRKEVLFAVHPKKFIMTRSFHSVISPIMLLPLLFLMLGSLNYSGFCYSKKRWLSDEEIIRAAVFQANSSTTLAVLGIRNGVPYESVDDLLAANPGCCSIGHDGGGEGPRKPFSTFEKLTGFGGEVVTIKFTAKCMDEYGRQQPARLRLTLAVTNCGLVT